VTLDLAGVKLDVQKLDEGCWWHIRMEGGVIVGDPVGAMPVDAPGVLVVPTHAGFERQVDREREPHVAQLRRDDLPDADRDRLIGEINGKAAAIKLLRDWRNLSFGGDVVPYSEAKATELLAMREWRNLLDFVIVAASQRQVALHEEEAAAAGN
jgi:hypothetical protein